MNENFEIIYCMKIISENLSLNFFIHMKSFFQANFTFHKKVLNFTLKFFVKNEPSNL